MPEELITPTSPEGGLNRNAEMPEADLQVSKRIEQQINQEQTEQAYKEQHDLPAKVDNGVPVFVEPGVQEKQAAAMAPASETILPAGAKDLTGPLVGKILNSEKDIEDAKAAPPQQLLESILDNIGKE